MILTPQATCYFHGYLSLFHVVSSLFAEFIEPVLHDLERMEIEGRPLLPASFPEPLPCRDLAQEVSLERPCSLVFPRLRHGLPRYFRPPFWNSGSNFSGKAAFTRFMHLSQRQPSQCFPPSDPQPSQMPRSRGRTRFTSVPPSDQRQSSPCAPVRP